MKTARILVLSFACLLLASNVLAQTQSAGERYVWPMGIPRPVPHTTMHTAGLDFTITRDTDWLDLSNDSEHSYLANVHNSSSDTLAIYFYRSQRLACGWISSVCWGTSCYSYSDDSEIAQVPPHTAAVLTLDLTPTFDDEPDSSVIWLRVGVAGGSASDTILLPFYASYLPSDTPRVFQWGGNPRFDSTFQGGGSWRLKNFLENHACRGIDYSLSLQDSLPTGWSLTFDDRRNPNSSTGDTVINLSAPFGAASLTTNFSDYGDSTYQQPITFTLTAPVVTKVDSAVIYLIVHPQTSNPADSANYRFVMYVQPQSSVAGAPEEGAGLAVTNAWPNPLVGSGALHLEILTDQAGPAKAVIYDVTGAQKGTLDLGMLHEGTNELQVAAPSLPSGEYIIRINQGGSASEVVRINYVK